MDFKTLYCVLVSVLLIEAVTLAQSWRQNRQEIGIRDWAISAVWMSFACVFSLAGLYLPLPGPSSIANLVLRDLGASAGATGWFYVWVGTRHFCHRPSFSYRAISRFLAAFTAAVTLNLWLPMPEDWLVILVSGVISFFAALNAREFARYAQSRNPTMLVMIAVLLFNAITWLLRSLTSIDHAAHLTRFVFVDALSLYDSILASVAMTVSMIVLTNERINRQLQELATIDPLTGIMNRRAFCDASAPLLGALGRVTEILTVCLLDLDHFKRLNDSLGHAAGDSALRQFAQLARTIVRQGDLIARFGGEEFVILFRNCDPAAAEQALLRLRVVCAEQVVDEAGRPLGLTFSAGLSQAVGPAEITIDSLLESADQAMYTAKSLGRDRTVIAGTPCVTELATARKVASCLGRQLEAL